MKRFIFSALILSIIACNNPSNEQQPATDSGNIPVDTITNVTKPDSVLTGKASNTDSVFSNKKFKDVKIQKLNDTTFRITGKAQVFEANFEWNIKEDNVLLKKGHTTTDAGAPEFGKFNFTVTAKKKNPSSTLEIVIFEPSANDGTPQGEMTIPLK